MLSVGSCEGRSKVAWAKLRLVAENVGLLSLFTNAEVALKSHCYHASTIITKSTKGEFNVVDESI